MSRLISMFTDTFGEEAYSYYDGIMTNLTNIDAYQGTYADYVDIAFLDRSYYGSGYGVRLEERYCKSGKTIYSVECFLPTMWRDGLYVSWTSFETLDDLDDFLLDVIRGN